MNAIYRVKGWKDAVDTIEILQEWLIRQGRVEVKQTFLYDIQPLKPDTETLCIIRWVP